MLKVIMLLANAFDPDPRVHNIAKVLSEKNYEVTIFAWDREGRYPRNEIIDKIRVVRPYLRSTYGKELSQLFAFLLFQVRAFVFLLRNNFDIVHPNDFDTLIPAFLAAKLKRKKIVYDCHEDYPAMMRDKNLKLLSVIIYRMQSFIIKRLDLILVVSPIFEKAFKEDGAKNVKLILNCKDLSEYIIQPDKIKDLRRRLNIENKFSFLYIGRLSKDRNLEEMVEIFKNISNPDIFFIIGGNGVLGEKIKTSSSFCKNVKFLGVVQPDQVPLYTRATDVVIAIYSKEKLNNVRSVPNKIFEAIAAGKPIIASKYGFTGQVINETKCGIAIDPGNADEIKKAVVEISTDKIFYDNIVSNSKKAQEIYNWKRVSEELLLEYQRLII